MREILVIVPKKVTAGRKILNMALFVLACIAVILAMMEPIVFTVPAVLLIALWVFMNSQTNVEFEYTYFDGDLHFAKIRNKSRRKRIADISMEDVLLIAPKGDRSVYKYETDKNIARKALISGNADAKIYELIYKGAKGTIRYEIEPEEELLDAIAVKYPRIVTK